MNTLVRLADLGRLHARTAYPLIPVTTRPTRTPATSAT